MSREHSQTKTLSIEAYAAIPALMLSKVLEAPMAPRLGASLGSMAAENLLFQAHFVTLHGEMGRKGGRSQANFDAGAKILAQHLKRGNLLKDVVK